MLQHSHIPSAWKISLTIPIYKGGNKPRPNPDSYRTISLLPAVYKLFEKVIHEDLKNQLNVKEPLFPNIQQQGYRKQMGSNTDARIYI